MQNLGVAKGSIDLDLGQMTSEIRSAVQELENIEAQSKQADAQIAVLQSTSTDTGNAFDQARNKAQKLAAELEKSRNKVKLYSKETETLQTQMEASKKAQADLAGTLADTRSKYEAANKTVQELDAAYRDSRANLEKIQKTHEANSEALKEAKEQTAKYAEALKEAKERSEDYAREISTMESQQERLDAEMDEAKRQLDSFGTECAYAQADVNKLTIELANVESTAQAFGGWMDDAGGKLQNFGSKIEGIGTKLTTAVTGPLVAAGTAAVAMSGDIEDSAAKLATIADTEAVTYADLQAGARDVSDATGAAWDEVNESMYQYISATGDTVGATNAAEIAVKAAVGGFTDASTAMDGLTSITNAYGMEGADAMQKVADMMLMTQNVGKTTFGELAGSIGQVVPTAVAANVPIEQLLGAVATLTSNGIGTSESMTALKAALSNIIKPTEEATEAAAALGINWDSATLEAKGLPAMLDDVKKAIANASPEYAKHADAVMGLGIDILNLEAENEDLQKQMEAEAEANSKNTDTYKALKAQVDANKDSIKGYNKDIEAHNKQMETLAAAADSPLSAYAELFGSVEALNSMMVLTSEDGGAKWLEFTEAIKESSGSLDEAFGTMQSTNADKLRRSINRLKNTAVEVGQKIAPVVSNVVEDVADLVERFGDLDEETQEMIIKAAGIAAAAGPVLTIGGKLIETTGGIASGIGGLIKKATEFKSAGAIVEGAAGTATAALGSSGGLLGVLENLLGPAGIAVVGAGAMGALAFAIMQVEQAAVDSNLAEHFGNVKLSMEEVEDVAKRITDTPWTATLDLYTDAAEELENMEDDIEDTVKEINKTQWKIDTGITLTDEEKQAYRDDITTFVGEMQELVEQYHYTTTLAINTIWGEGSTVGANIADFSDQVYGGVQAELDKLGAELSDIVNKAFEEGMLDDEATRQLIAQKEQEIQDILDEVAQARFDVNLRNVVATIPDGSLTPESFKDVQEELTSLMQERKEEIEQAKIDLMVPYQLELNRGEIDQEQFDAMVRETTLEAAARMGEVDLQGINYEIQTIQGTYSETTQEEADKFADDLRDKFQKRLDTFANDLDVQGLVFGVENDLSSGFGDMSWSTRQAVSKLVTAMQPQKEELEAIAQQYRDAGKAVPQNIADGIADIETLQAMTGNVDATYNILADAVANSPELQKAMAEMYDSGTDALFALLGPLEEKYPEVYASISGMYDKMEQDAKDKSETTNETMEDLGGGLSGSMATGITKESGQVTEAAEGVVQNVFDTVDGADGGTVDVNLKDPQTEAAAMLQKLQTFLDSHGVHVNVSAVLSGGASSFFSAAAAADTYANRNIAGAFPFPQMDAPEIFDDGIAADIPATIAADGVAMDGIDIADTIAGVTGTARLAAYAIPRQATGSGNTGGSIADGIAERLEKTLRDAPIAVSVEMEDGDVYIDGEKAGRKLAPTISRIQAKKVR